MSQDIKPGAETPDKKSQEVIDGLQKQGNTFENLSDEAPKEEPEKVEKEPEAPAEDQPKGKEAKPPKEPAKEGEEEAEETEEEEEEKEPGEEKKPERAPRKPVWVEKMEERRGKQKETREELILKGLQELTNVIKDLKTGNPPKSEAAPPEGQPSSERTAKVKEIKEKYQYDVAPELIEDIVSMIPEIGKSELPKEVQEKLTALDQLIVNQKREREDREYTDEFSEKVQPLIKTDFPQATDEDIRAIKERLKGHYFNERYVNLGITEIYNLKRDDLSKQVSPANAKTGEHAKRGIKRGEKVIDPETITEEEFQKLSPEEQQTVIDWKAKNSKQ